MGYGSSPALMTSVLAAVSCSVVAMAERSGASVGMASTLAITSSLALVSCWLVATAERSGLVVGIWLTSVRISVLAAVSCSVVARALVSMVPPLPDGDCETASAGKR